MSAMPDIAVLHHAGDLVGESPLWDPDESRIWWVDITGRAVRCLELATGEVRNCDTPVPPGAIALDESGGVVIAAGTGWYRLDSADCRLAQIAAIADAPSGVRMNDGAVDHEGRFWAGIIPLAPSPEAVGRLYRLDASGPLMMLDGLRTQNGTAISPDGRTFYVADSHPDVRTIWAYDFDMSSGALANRRVFHRPEQGRPDGAAMDADGCYWFAAIDAGRIVRLDPQGREMQVIALPVSRPTNIAFYGAELGMMCITTMGHGLDDAQRAVQPLAGGLLAIEAGVRGWPQPRFRSVPVASLARAGKLETG